MKMKNVVLAALALLCLFQAQASARNALAAGARYQTRHSQYLELPYNNGDMTYQLGYEIHDAAGFWQVLIGFTPEVSSGSDGRGTGVESVLTPQLNLLFEDRNWLAGVGILSSYIRHEDADNEWTGIYWQVMFGYQIPLGAFHLELMAYYPFEKWKTFRDFKGEDLEYGVLLKRLF